MISSVESENKSNTAGINVETEGSNRKVVTGWMSLEEFIRYAARAGMRAEAAQIMNTLPEKQRERYRQIWKEETERFKNERDEKEKA